MQDSPLHPFELHPYMHISLFGLDISLNKAVIMMWVVIALAAWFLIAAGRQRRLIPTRLQSVAEMLVEFLRDMILDTMGKAGMRFFPFIASLFIFILFAYAMSIVVGFAYHGIRFLHILIPPGTPPLLLPLMMPIELISQLARPFALAVRLFANMTAGHTILAVLFGMALSLPLLIGWLPFAFTVAISVLEVGIAFIQAYIFTILTCVYLGDAINLHGHSEGAH